MILKYVVFTIQSITAVNNSVNVNVMSPFVKYLNN